MDMTVLIVALLAGYMVGSIPFGLLFARWLAGVDPRQVGSGNIGATNAMRAGGRKVGVLTLVADMLKGAVPVAATLPLEQPLVTAVVVLAAVLGHLYPVWLGFHGGKGVATMLGVMTVWQPVAAVAAVIAWLLCYGVGRYVSLASIVAGVVPTLWLMLTGNHSSLDVLVAAVLSLLLVARHRANIERLMRGEEPKTR